jgi:hypothetical protein
MKKYTNEWTEQELSSEEVMMSQQPGELSRWDSPAYRLSLDEMHAFVEIVSLLSVQCGLATWTFTSPGEASVIATMLDGHVCAKV